MLVKDKNRVSQELTDLKSEQAVLRNELNNLKAQQERDFQQIVQTQSGHSQRISKIEELLEQTQRANLSNFKRIGENQQALHQDLKKISAQLSFKKDLLTRSQKNEIEQKVKRFLSKYSNSFTGPSVSVSSGPRSITVIASINYNKKSSAYDVFEDNSKKLANTILSFIHPYSRKGITLSASVNGTVQTKRV